MDIAALADLFSTIPEFFWGALTGAIVPLITVWIANRHNLKHQRQQFEFESRERQRERQVNLRRDVYLPAADALIGMTTAISSLVSTDVTDAELNSRVQAFGSAMTRIQMVSSPETLKLVAELQRAYLGEMLALQKLRFPMMLRKADIDIAANTQQSHSDERKRCLELMKEYNLAGTRDLQRWQTIQELSDFANEGWTEANREWTRLAYHQEVDRLKMARELSTRMDTLTKMQAPVLAAVRSELESSGAPELILEEAEKTSVAMVAYLNELIPVIEAGLEGMRKDVEADEQSQKDNLPQS